MDWERARAVRDYISERYGVQLVVVVLMYILLFVLYRQQTAEYNRHVIFDNYINFLEHNGVDALNTTKYYEAQSRYNEENTAIANAPRWPYVLTFILAFVIALGVTIRLFWR